jgi:hypothetical protein
MQNFFQTFADNPVWGLGTVSGSSRPFLFQKVKKEELAGCSLIGGSLKSAWEGVIRSII